MRSDDDVRRKPAPRRGALSDAWRLTTRIALGLAVMSGALFLSLDAISARMSQPAAQDATAAVPVAVAPVWTFDIDGDGAADLANPTHNAIRGADAYGSGKFGAQRDKGKRKHEGTDFVAAPGAQVWSPLNGVVTAIGYAYHDDINLQFIEVKDPVRQLSARVFYIDPSVKVGQAVAAGDVLGAAESLGARYPKGITNHIHVELRDGGGRPIDPGVILPTGARMEMAALDVIATLKPRTPT